MEISHLDVCQYCGCVFDFTTAMKSVGELKIATCPACKHEYELPDFYWLRDKKIFEEQGAKETDD